jgi:plastocyanin
MPLFVGGLIVVLAVVGVVAYMAMQEAPVADAPDIVSDEVNLVEPVTAPVDVPASEVVSEGEVRTIVVSGKNFSFSPHELRVKKGERVKIVFTSDDGFHDFVVDELSLRTQVLSKGQTEEIEFTADTAGSFEYYCSVGNHRQMGMKGTLIVE